MGCARSARRIAARCLALALACRSCVAAPAPKSTPRRTARAQRAPHQGPKARRSSLRADACEATRCCLSSASGSLTSAKTATTVAKALTMSATASPGAQTRHRHRQVVDVDRDAHSRVERGPPLDVGRKEQEQLVGGEGRARAYAPGRELRGRSDPSDQQPPRRGVGNHRQAKEPRRISSRDRRHFEPPPLDVLETRDHVGQHHHDGATELCGSGPGGVAPHRVSGHDAAACVGPRQAASARGPPRTHHAASDPVPSADEARKELYGPSPSAWFRQLRDVDPLEPWRKGPGELARRR